MSKVAPSVQCKRLEDAFMNVGPETGDDKSLNPGEATGTSATPGPTKVASLRKSITSLGNNGRKLGSSKSKSQLSRQDSRTSNGSERTSLSKEQAQKMLRVGENAMLVQLGQEISTARSKVLSVGENILQSTPFTSLVALVILANAILEGVETHVQPSTQDSNWLWIGRSFLAFYTLELVTRLLVYGLPASIKDTWFLFDAVIVIAGLVEFFVEILFSSHGGGANLSQFRVLKLLRILKLLRVFRVLRFCEELLILVNSLASALTTTMWTWTLLVLVIYVFSITFTKTLGHGYPDNDELQERWGTIWRSAFTLFGMTTLEWIETARLYFNEEPLMIVLTVIFVVVTAFAVLNVTVAVIVDHTIERGMDSAEKRQQQIEKDLKQTSSQIINVFLDADENGDGEMSKDEFQKAIADPKIARALKELELDNVDMKYLFDQLDLNRNGSISLHEFVQGTLQLRGPAKAKRLFELHCDVLRENISLQHDLQEIKRKQRDHEQLLNQTVVGVNQVASRQDSLSKSLDTSLGQMTEALNSLVKELRINHNIAYAPDEKLIV